ncbi:MAG: ornithine carbamoyltransferase [Deltaproteobacteria bacterium]|nr:MAG: ornithine carbamoyltransferase [Deltaproteobacteria bacterium]
MSAVQHFLALTDLDRPTLERLLDRALVLKAMQGRGEPHATRRGRTLGMVFEKASTRTRVSFEVGMHHLGGHAVLITPRDSQIGRGEPIQDTARVLSRYVDAILLRTYAHETLLEFARHATVPVINGLTDLLHPCQLLADLLTLRERGRDLAHEVVAWVGDGNNMAHSWIHAARIFGFELRIATPPGYRPDPTILEGAGSVLLTGDPAEAVAGATVVATDVWASMGQEAEAAERRAAFAGFEVDETLVARAHPEHLILHCLPAHRGEEISEAVLEGPHSAVFDAAENRLHAQKALLEWLLPAARSESPAPLPGE